MRAIIRILCLALLSGALLSATVRAQTEDPVTLDFLWYDDSTESILLRRQIGAFEEQNPGVTVNLRVVSTPEEINAELQNAIGTPSVPDLARTNIPSNYSQHLLDMRPYLNDPETWEARFREGYHNSLRDDPNDGGLHGYPVDMTISGPYINRTMWETAGVPIPDYQNRSITWEEWITAATQVQVALDNRDHDVYAIAFDPSGHRFWGPSLSLCATYIDMDAPFTSEVTINTPGFRRAAELLKSWHDEGLIPPEIWDADAETRMPADEFFIDSQVAFYFSGSWQLANFDDRISDFEWEPIPNPSGPCGRTGMIGGTSVIAFNPTQQPESVSNLVEFLTQEDNLLSFYEQNLLLPGHLDDMTASRLNYSEDVDRLTLFQAELENALDEAYALQYRSDSGDIHGAIRRGLTAMINDDLTIEETIRQIEADLYGES
jgi:alpha-1,4-digalacturonate transport system substrate-binding protein